MSTTPPAFSSPDAAGQAGGAHATSLRLFRLVAVLATQLRRLSDARFRGVGMTTRQAELTTIAKILGKPSLTELAAMMSTSHQNVKQIARGLVQRGFARFEEDPRDARVRRLVITARSDRFWAARDEDDAAAIAGWFSALTSEDQQTANRLLAALSTHLMTVEAPEPPDEPATRRRR